MDTPKPIAKNVEDKFSAIRAQEHIEVISREPHSYYDRDEHEKVRQYLVDTLSNYLGVGNVFEYNYTINEVQTELDILNNNGSPFKYDIDGVIHPIQNVLGVLPGTSPKGILLMSHYDSRGHVGRSGEQGRSYGAMDDGYGVSTMLEFAYLLKDENPENSVYFLFTDAEEVGLYGAAMASRESAVMDNVKFVINLEARGIYGPSYMFETSNNNHEVIYLYRKANLPVSYSIATVVYSVMPNFTDFTPMIETGVPGLNFAVLAGLDYYHTPLDSYQNIDISTLQHMGGQIEPIVREFISNSQYVEDDHFTASSNQVFFTIFKGILISYSKVMAIVLVAVLIILFGLVTTLKIKRKELNKGILTNTLPKSLLVFVAAVIVGIIYSMIVAALGKVSFSVTYTRVSNTEIPTLLLLILMTLGLFKLIKNKENDLLYLGVVINLLLTILTTFTLEGASFLFAFTTLFGLIALLSDLIPHKWIRFLVLGFSYAFIILMIIPILWSFYMALTVGGTVILIVLLTINFMVTGPTILKQIN